MRQSNRRDVNYEKNNSNIGHYEFDGYTCLW